MVKIGILGVGYLGKIHLKLWLEIPTVQVIGFFDINPETAAEVEKTFGVKAFPDAESLITVCDAIDIVTPTLVHFECAKQVLAHNKHFFVEKPFTNTLQEAEEILALAKEKQILGQVGHVERFNPAWLAVQHLSIQPVFIEGHRLAPWRTRGKDVAVVLELMIHDLDIILKIVQSPLVSVQANGVSVLSDSPDICNARLEFENGCVANLTASRISMKSMRKLRIFQKDAYLSVDFLEKQAEIIRLAAEEEIFEEGMRKMPIAFDTNKGQKTVVLEMPEIQTINAIQTELAAFADSVISGKPTLVTLAEGYEALKVAHWILDKIK